MPRFGKPANPRTFEWVVTDPDGTEQVRTFRGRPALPFEDAVEFNRLSSHLVADAWFSRLDFNQKIRAIKDGDDYAVAKKLADDQAAEELGRWEMVLRQVELLVDGPEFVQLLRDTKPDGVEVRKLRDWLEKAVIASITTEVEAAAGVDPTSPKSPDDSPSTEPPGPDSESEG